MRGTDSPEVEILVGERASSGSGRLVAPSLALTARHVLFAPDGTPYGTPRLRLLDDSRERPCVKVWDGGTGLDLALVRLTAEVDHADVEHARWGAFVGTGADFRCEATGFPWAQEREGGWREIQQVRLRVALATGRIEGLIQADVDAALPERRRDGATWGGLSGAAVTVVDAVGVLVVGVVVAETERHAARSLTVVPVHRALRDAGFRSAIENAGGFATPEPAELLQMLVPPAPRAPASPASLLRADVETVPFHGRAEELGLLHDWAEGSGLSVRMITGPGGQGKSRLARQFAAELARDGWTVGLLGDIRQTADQFPYGRLQGCRRNTLLIVDYAETKPELIAWLLARLARPKAAVRVLLLARSAEGWLQDLADSSFELGELLATAEVYELTGSASALEDAERFRTTMRTFVSALGRLPDTWGAHEPSPAELERLFAVRYESPLAAQMAALAAVLGDPADETAGGKAARSPEAVILSHERRYWRGVADAGKLDLSVPVLRAAVAAATLCGAADAEAATALVGRVPDLADQPRTVLRAVSGWLATLYPTPGTGVLGSLQPDVLGESLVAALIREQPGWLPAVLAGAAADQAMQALTILARAVDRHEHVRGDLDRLFDAVPDLVPSAVRVAAQIAEPDLLISPTKRVLSSTAVNFGFGWDVYQALPEYSHRLRDFALEVTVNLAQAAATLAAEEPAFLRPLFTLLSDAGSRYDAVGQADRFLQHTELAIALYENRLSHLPDAPVSGYVVALSNLAGAYTKHHRLADAARHAIRAADITHTWLTAADPALVRAGVGAYSAAAAVLLPSGRISEAFAYSAAAIEPMRKLAATSDLATALTACTFLSNHASILRHLGDLEKALETAGEAVLILRSRAAQTTDVGREHLAHALSVVSAALADLGKPKEAYAPLAEAIAILEGLSARDDLAFAPRLADLYGDLAVTLKELGRHDEALAAARQQLYVFRRCHAALPEVFEPALPAALNRVANCLARLDRHEEAMAAAEEAWTIIQPLFQAAPAEHLDQMIRIESQIADLLRRSGQAEAALAMVRHHIDLVLAYAEDLDAWQERLAVAWQIASQCAEDADDHEQAVSAAAQSCFAHGLGLTTDMRADGLRNLLRLLGNRSPADADKLDLVTRALTEYRALAEEGPVPRYEQIVAEALDTYSRTLAAAGRLEDSIPPAEDAARTARTAEASASNRPTLGRLLQNLSTRYFQAGRLAEALAAVEEALAIRQSLFESDPDRFTTPVLMSLRHKAQVLALLDDVPAAIAVAVTAVPLAPENLQIPLALDALLHNLIELCPESVLSFRTWALSWEYSSVLSV